MIKKIAAATITLTIAATAVFAASHAGPFDGAITARQSHMRLYGHNIGVLGGMAQGKIGYDADAAAAAAGNLLALSKLNQSTYWPVGSDSFDNANTRALPALWDNFGDVGKKATDLIAAAAAMDAAAGGGLGALQAAMGPLGGACGACHKAYRQPK